MVVKLDSSGSPLPYKFTRRAGKSITSKQPVFSPDGESLLVVVENIVRVYSIQTAECTRTLETEKDVNSLVAVRFPENEKFNLYGCSDRGLVSIWTWANGTVLREIQLHLPFGIKVLSFDLLDSNECFIVGLKPKDQYFFLATYSMKTGQMSIEYKATKIYRRYILSVSLGWCDGDRYAAICNGTMVLFIQNLIQPHLRTEINNHNKLRVISVSAHPRESSVAITDTLGRVTVIRGYLYNYNNLAKEVFHWHYLPVLATCFSKEGTYLFSGGMEKVLVKWTSSGLSHRAQEKQVIPRLPGIIKYIATDNVNVAISLTNNCIVIASAQMRVITTILECGGLSGRARSLGPDLAYHRGSGALLLAGRPGHLQMYSTVTNHLLYNIDITQVNPIPPSRENILPIELEVSCVATSADGNWLVTSEYRNDTYMYPEERLKFWIAQSKGSTPFKLNTCVNLSHGGCRVVSIALSNNGSFCVSAGLDQKFRIWKCDTHKDGKTKTFSWSCLTACYYSTGFSQSTAHEILNDFKNSDFNKADKEDRLSYMTQYKRDDIVEKILNLNGEDSRTEKEKVGSCVRDGDLEMGGVAISQDGSLIAAWFGSKLTLWDTHQCTLRTTLAHPVLKSKGLQVRFGNNDAAHYIVCTTEDCLAVWSLLSLTLKWYVNITPSCLAADPFSNKLAVVTDANDVCIFTPHSSSPVLRRERLVDSRSGVFARCSFALAANDEVRLYLMRNDSEIYCLEPEESSESRLEVISRRALPATNFSALLAEQQLSEVKSLQATSLQYLDSDTRGKNAISQFLSGAPHMMPPVSLLCTSFLEHISGRKIVEPADDPRTMEVDDPSSEDDDWPVPITGNTQRKKVDLWIPNYEQVKEHKLKKILQDTSIDIDVALSLFEKLDL